MRQTAIQHYLAKLDDEPNPDLQLVLHAATQYEGCGLPLDELVAEGNLGLAEALHLMDIGKLERPFAVEASACIQARIREAIVMHKTAGTVDGLLAYDTMAVNEVGDEMHHGQLHDLYDEAYELKYKLDIFGGRSRIRGYMCFMYYYGIDCSFGESYESIGERMNLTVSRIKYLIHSVLGDMDRLVPWNEFRPSPAAVGLLLDMYYLDKGIFHRPPLTATRHKSSKWLKQLTKHAWLIPIKQTEPTQVPASPKPEWGKQLEKQAKKATISENLRPFGRLIRFLYP